MESDNHGQPRYQPLESDHESELYKRTMLAEAFASTLAETNKTDYNHASRSLCKRHQDEQAPPVIRHKKKTLTTSEDNR